MQHLVESWSYTTKRIAVQPGRYRYLASTDTSKIMLRIVLGEYLACEVVWDS